MPVPSDVPGAHPYNELPASELRRPAAPSRVFITPARLLHQPTENKVGGAPKTTCCPVSRPGCLPQGEVSGVTSQDLATRACCPPVETPVCRGASSLLSCRIFGDPATSRSRAPWTPGWCLRRSPVRSAVTAQGRVALQLTTRAQDRSTETAHSSSREAVGGPEKGL